MNRATRQGPKVIVVLVIAANLRFGVTTAGALLHQLGVSGAVASVLTALPIVCFGLAGLAAAPLMARWGREKLLAVALGCLIVGLVVRGADTVATLVAGTMIAMAGVAIGNVMLPAVVRTYFPDRVTQTTGHYSAALVLASAIGAAGAVPLAQVLGSPQLGLAVWAVPALVAWLMWAGVVRGAGRVAMPKVHAPAGQPLTVRAVARHSTARWLILFFGAQAFTGYVVLEWMPAVLVDRGGVGATAAGVLVGVAVLISGVLAVLLPRWTVALPDLRWVVVGVSVPMAGGFVGLLVAPATAPVFWTVLEGMGLGVFPLSLILIGLRAATPQGTATLSVLTQSAGYLTAGACMTLFGSLKSVSGGYTWPLVLALFAVAAQTVAGIRVAHHNTPAVDKDHEPMPRKEVEQCRS